MSDIGGPRRPLDLRPSARPEAAPAVPPATRQAPRPAQQRPAQQRPAASRPAASPVSPIVAPRSTAPGQAIKQRSPETHAKTGGAWKTVMQFIIGVVIIVLVAFSIVVLYVKYYAG